MKRMKITVLALAVLAMGACTSDDAVVTESNNTTNWGGDGYVSFNINLPTQTGTRAANDVYEDGDPCEYTVNDATLLLFKGSSESLATFYAAYNLTNTFEAVADEEDGITSRATVTQEITTDGIAETDNLYAMVVLNKRGMLEITGSGQSATGYFGGVQLSSSTLFSDLQDNSYAADLSYIADRSGTNFFMTNAPLFSKAGGNANPSGGSVSTLAQVNIDDIHSTEDAATASPAANIYVERGVSKVTVSTSGELSLDGSYDVSIDGFILDQTNTVMYPVRNATEDAWWAYTNSQVIDSPYRFVSEKSVGKATPSGDDDDLVYRTYWGIDPNYDTYNNSEITSVVGSTPTGGELTAADGDSPLYCLENTFNVENMNKNATTRVIVAATITKSGDAAGTGFYTVDDDGTILDEAAVVDFIKKELLGVSYIHNASQVYTGGEGEFMANAVKVALDITEGQSEEGVKIVVTVDGSVGTYTDGGTAYDLLAADLALGDASTVNTAINGLVEVSYYAGGVCYYPIMIEHFGDDLTPWSSENITGLGSYPDGTAYGTTAEQAWLGRYGTVRNNWYVIVVKDIQGVGYATVPEVTSDPDDPMYKYVAVKINVLPWAKRIQEVTL